MQIFTAYIESVIAFDLQRKNILSVLCLMYPENDLILKNYVFVWRGRATELYFSKNTQTVYK